MAYATITLKNPQTSITRQAPIGFSWTVLLFNFLPPLFRSDWKWAIIMFIIALLTWGLSAVLFAFIYNKLYLKDLIQAGFKAKSVEHGSVGKIARKLKLDIPTA